MSSAEPAGGSRRAGALVASAALLIAGLRPGEPRPKALRFAFLAIFITVMYVPLTLGIWPHNPIPGAVAQASLFGLGMAGSDWWRTSARRNNGDHYVTMG